MEQLPRLSNREWDVVNLLREGKSNKMIASALGITERTVEFHLKNIYDKLQVGSRVELVLKLGESTVTE
ncbi:MAG TPA: LuxR C-terminal-related transcriptional regulator, partial [Promineifilum sp.]|nr:LuxR C-terminal-related transcriptional regulator [Promineifilum sp.]